MSKVLKKKKLDSSASDSLTLNKKITTVEELENYERIEQRTKVVINKQKIPLFAKHEMFRNTVKNPVNYINYYKDDRNDVRTYVLKRWDLLPAPLQELISNESIEHSQVFDTIKYEDITTEEAFKLVINDDNGVMVGFETIGHIAHLNVPEERSSIKKLIAKIIMDKHRHIKTVINKRSELQNQFRTMDLELLAGEENYVANLVENGLKFEVDFANVYWNSRLIQERTRIRDLLHPDDIVVDMFAGVGPFAIYASKKGCNVLANDLNPIGAKYMKRNSELNKVTNRVRVYNEDARDFLINVVKENKILDKKKLEYDKMELKENGRVQFIMNLPKIAIEFLADNIQEESIRKCLVHCYCFCGSDEYEKEIEQRLSDALGTKLSEYTITKVRDISPNKQMYCVEFECPVSILKGKNR